jgi:hypothetical protein
MGCRFLILNDDYPEFLSWLYSQHPGLEGQPFAEQMRVRMGSLAGLADFYSTNLRQLGHEAWDLHINNEWMQRAWAREHGIKVAEPMSKPLPGVLQQVRRMAVGTPLRHLKPLFRSVLRSLDGTPPWCSEVLAAQIQHYRPDVLLNQALSSTSLRFLREVKPFVRLLVGQHAATRLPEAEDFSAYDLVISSFPPTVDYFRRQGIPAELHRLAFEPQVLSHLEAGERRFDLTFSGSFYSVHSSRVALLKTLRARFPQMQVWGPASHYLAAGSPLRSCYAGEAWGREMYQVLRDSKLTLNHHGDVLPYANNLRLFEATGVGTLLITDWKANLREMFEPGREVVAYRTTEECLELIAYYLEHAEERERIARAGQQRTLREHTYYHRMQELADIVRTYLGRSAVSSPS